MKPTLKPTSANAKKYSYYIGIDCGVNTGICVWSHYAEKIMVLKTCKIHKAMQEVEYWSNYYPGEVMVRVEDARKARFGRQNDSYKAQGAGSVMRDSKIWEDYLSDLGVAFELVRPNKATTKWNAETFKKATGYLGSTSTHARDSALMVFGL